MTPTGPDTIRGTDTAPFLERMIALRRAWVAERYEAPIPEPFPREGEPLDLVEALTAEPTVSVIAEVKKASPSLGPIAPDADVAERVVAYEAGGADAVSVLVEPAEFGGSFGDISVARAGTRLPILCKDFVIDPAQLFLARNSGADGVLLMVSVLGDGTRAFVGGAQEFGLTPLVEVHDAAEYELAAASGAELIGVNSRDLRDLSVDAEAALALVARAADDGFAVVAESGVGERAQVEAAAEAGACAVLVGTTLMRSENPVATLEGLTGVAMRHDTDSEDGPLREG
jgi:indole-3-glycerol phosphate synthase